MICAIRRGGTHGKGGMQTCEQAGLTHGKGGMQTCEQEVTYKGKEGRQTCQHLHFFFFIQGC